MMLPLVIGGSVAGLLVIGLVVWLLMGSGSKENQVADAPPPAVEPAAPAPVEKPQPKTPLDYLPPQSNLFIRMQPSNLLNFPPIKTWLDGEQGQQLLSQFQQNAGFAMQDLDTVLLAGELDYVKLAEGMDQMSTNTEGMRSTASNPFRSLAVVVSFTKDQPANEFGWIGEDASSHQGIQTDGMPGEVRYIKVPDDADQRPNEVPLVVMPDSKTLVFPQLVSLADLGSYFKEARSTLKTRFASVPTDSLLSLSINVENVNAPSGLEQSTSESLKELLEFKTAGGEATLIDLRLDHTAETLNFQTTMVARDDASLEQIRPLFDKANSKSEQDLSGLKQSVSFGTTEGSNTLSPEISETERSLTSTFKIPTADFAPLASMAGPMISMAMADQNAFNPALLQQKFEQSASNQLLATTTAASPLATPTPEKPAPAGKPIPQLAGALTTATSSSGVPNGLELLAAADWPMPQRDDQEELEDAAGPSPAPRLRVSLALAGENADSVVQYRDLVVDEIEGEGSAALKRQNVDEFPYFDSRTWLPTKSAQTDDQGMVSFLPLEFEPVGSDPASIKRVKGRATVRTANETELVEIDLAGRPGVGTQSQTISGVQIVPGTGANQGTYYLFPASSDVALIEIQSENGTVRRGLVAAPPPDPASPDNRNSPPGAPPQYGPNYVPPNINIPGPDYVPQSYREQPRFDSPVGEFSRKRNLMTRRESGTLDAIAISPDAPAWGTLLDDDLQLAQGGPPPGFVPPSGPPPGWKPPEEQQQRPEGVGSSGPPPGMQSGPPPGWQPPSGPPPGWQPPDQQTSPSSPTFPNNGTSPFGGQPNAQQPQAGAVVTVDHPRHWAPKGFQIRLDSPGKFQVKVARGLKESPVEFTFENVPVAPKPADATSAPQRWQVADSASGDAAVHPLFAQAHWEDVESNPNARRLIVTVDAVGPKAGEIRSIGNYQFEEITAADGRRLTVESAYPGFKERPRGFDTPDPNRLGLTLPPQTFRFDIPMLVSDPNFDSLTTLKGSVRIKRADSRAEALVPSLGDYLDKRIINDVLTSNQIVLKVQQAESQTAIFVQRRDRDKVLSVELLDAQGVPMLNLQPKVQVDPTEDIYIFATGAATANQLGLRVIVLQGVVAEQLPFEFQNLKISPGPRMQTAARP